MSKENKLHIVLINKETGERALATGITQMAREFSLHENTVRKIFNKAVGNGGIRETKKWMMYVFWEYIKGNQGKKVIAKNA